MYATIHLRNGNYAVINGWHVTITSEPQQRSNTELFVRNIDNDHKQNWCDPPHIKITNAIDALEKALEEATE